MRLTIRLYPSSRVARIGGRYGDTAPPVLIVRLLEPAVDDRANAAAIKLLSVALNVPSGQIRIVSGHRQRQKVVDVGAVSPAILASLLDD